jgi:hypothetical protein
VRRLEHERLRGREIRELEGALAVGRRRVIVVGADERALHE